MKTFGALYIGKLNYYHRNFFPIVEHGVTQETQMPYRRGNCLVFRFPFTKPGVYAGIFSKPTVDPRTLSDEEIDEIFLDAMGVTSVWNPQKLKEGEPIVPTKREIKKKLG
jgi:hypothetical protein